MKPIYFSALIILAGLASCDDGDDVVGYVDPRYAEMAAVTEVTSTSATFTLKIKSPVIKTLDGFQVDGKHFRSYTFYYSTDPDLSIRLWKQAEGTVADDSGSYHLKVNDLSPDTRYYVKASVVIAPREQMAYNFSFSASVLEFETTN